MSLGWSGSGVGLRAMIPGSVQLVGRNCQGAGPGVRSHPHEPGWRFGSCQHTTFWEVAGMVRAEGL